METIGDRIKQVRKENQLTIVKFGERIGISNPAVSMIESGKSNPSDQTIRSICREFKVNEIWLRTGEGEMHQAMTENEELAVFTGEVLAAAPEDIRKRILSAIAKWTPEMWMLAEKIADQLENKEHPDG